MSALGKRISRAGVGVASPGERRKLPLAALFSGCSASVRDKFYDKLQFRDGRLVGMFVKGIKKCGERDLPRFLSLFGPAGMGGVEWKQDSYCKQAGTCARKSGYVCGPDNG